MMNAVAMLANEAKRHPDRVQLVDGDARITLGQLWQSASALSSALQQAGVKSGDRIAIVGANSPQWVQVYLGVLVAGAVAVPLNPELRAQDIAALIRHSGARFAFVDVNSKLNEALLVELPEIIWLVKAGCFSEHCIDLNTLPQNDSLNMPGIATDLACILYTSGTTGAPKGVMLGHEGLLQNALDVSEYLQLSPQDASLAILPFYYSFGNSVLLTHLISGSRLVFGASLMYPERLLALVEQEKITGLSGVPSLFALLSQRELLSDPRWQSLRYVAQAGGALASALADNIQRFLVGRQLFVMYGQTEATARISYLPPEYQSEKRGSVGWPLPDTAIQIRDESGKILAAGEVGYVWVRGPGVMQGYWRNAQATAEVLVDGWLNTGDMGELDFRGFLYIRGRRSDMLKVSGQRLHPQEVEAVIAELPQVAECAVDGVEDTVLGQVPRAFVVLKAGEALTDMELMKHCRAQLAGWKVPRTVEMLTALPKTGSGKIQRHLLSEVLSCEREKLKEGHA